jgi:NADPH-dependent glutamate synthase beta subunit-like oxidoreductase
MHDLRGILEEIALNIDGHELKTEKGKTVLQAALDAGIYIPHLCYHPDLTPFGACRLCVVEIEGMRGIPTACTTPAAEGMVVTTRTPQVDRIRRLAMELMLAGHPPDCTTCPKYLNCELQSLKQYLGVSEGLRVKRRPKAFPVNSSNPLFLHDLGRCILCGRCVTACYELVGAGVLSFIKSGSETYIGTAFDRPLADAGCRFCGACVEVCPTGAIRDHAELLEAGKNRRAALIPCKYTCPAQIDVPRYIRFIREMKYPAAVAVIREKVPFPLVLGYVCDHPCETVCRHSQLNEAIAIRELKRFAAERDDESWKKNSRKTPSTGKRVAIVGSGPAGLTAAYYLAKLGHNVTVFEALPLPGGMLRVGIPEYRLPRDVLNAEIRQIESVGVDIRTNTRVDSLNRFFEEGYNAILVATGAHQSQKLPIPGADLDGVLMSLDFLKDINLSKEIKLGEKVVVLGGGNVAFDCARVARRLGAKEVHIACLECRENMPADSDEIEQGEAEGIVVHPAHTFTRILSDHGHITGVECLDVQSFEFDEDGKACANAIEGSEHILPADTIIFAIGQRPEIPAQFGLTTSRGNTIQVDEYTHATNKDGVFAAGDAVSGTASVIKAIASGRNMASAIDSYLGGSGIIDEELAPVEEPGAWLGRGDNFAYQHRCQVSLVPLQQRLDSSSKVVHGYDEEAALKESLRCLQCDLRFKISAVKFWANYSSVE